MCSIHNCRAIKLKGRGLCEKHYNQYKSGKLLGDFPKIDPRGDVGKILGGLPCSYRQLDYWIRSGRIVLQDKSSGSGNRRKLTDKEKTALRSLVDIQKSLSELQKELNDGTTWRRLMEEKVS